jgi:hypothetical protein
LAENVGLKAEFGDWTEASVFWFEGFMPDEVRRAGTADSSLEYFDSDGTPHNPAGEGFIDRSAKTALSFLIELKE